jgi:DNA-directed RNA polymerase subunit RPC12/RpoP
LEVPIMTVYEVLTVTLIVVLALLTTVAIYLGLMNWLGALYVVRCDSCHHQTFSSAKQPQHSCPHCRHPVLTHPLYAVRHPRDLNQIRVVGDRLRY